MTLNFGITNTMSVETTTATASTPMPMTQPMDRSVRATWITPPTARMGAYASMRSVITVIVWICWMSLVARVMSEAALKRWMSASENATTRAYMRLRSVRPTLAPVRVASRFSMTLTTTPPATSASMSPGAWRSCSRPTCGRTETGKR